MSKKKQNNSNNKTTRKTLTDELKVLEQDIKNLDVSKENLEHSIETLGRPGIIRLAVFAVLVIFVLVFLFNLIRFNFTDHVSSKTLQDNIKTVQAMQTAEVDTIQKAADKILTDKQSGSVSGIRAIYRRKFKNCVILGDSLTEGLVVYGWLPSSQVFADIGGSIVYGDKNFHKAAKRYPEQAFFAYGMNDMGNYAGNAKNFIKKYKQLLRDFHKTSPDTKINICSITTPTKGARKGNKSIRHYKEFNRALKKMCEDKGYNYIDVTDILPSHPDLYAGDGIHAAASYYPYWMKRVAESAGL